MNEFEITYHSLYCNNEEVSISLEGLKRDDMYTTTPECYQRKTEF